MSTIITRPAFEGPHILATTAPTLLAMNEACRQMDLAQQVLQNYVDAKRQGKIINCFVWRTAVELTGMGKVWKDKRGHRTLHRVRVTYGDWAALDALIEEALAHYAAQKS